MMEKGGGKEQNQLQFVFFSWLEKHDLQQGQRKWNDPSPEYGRAFNTKTM